MATKDKDEKFNRFLTIAGTAVVTAGVFYLVNKHMQERREIDQLNAAKKLQELNAAKQVTGSSE